MLGPVDAFCVVVGSRDRLGDLPGPGEVAHDVPFISGIIWSGSSAGIFSGAGALTLAELGAMMPQAGGLYVYLRAAYGPLLAFLFGWVEFLVVRSRLDGDPGRGVRPVLRATLPAAGGDPRRSLAGRRGRAGDRGGDHGQRPGHAAGRNASGHGDVLKVGGVGGADGPAVPARRGTLANLTPVWPSAMGGSIFTGMMAAMVERALGLRRLDQRHSARRGDPRPRPQHPARACSWAWPS